MAVFRSSVEVKVKGSKTGCKPVTELNPENAVEWKWTNKHIGSDLWKNWKGCVEMTKRNS